MTNLLKNLLLALGLVLVAYFGYRSYISDSTPLISSTNPQGTSLETQQFLSSLQELNDLEIDRGFFAEPRFSSFVDYRQNIVDVPAGRPNPFAPVQ